jgi:hypothetical protein
MPPERSGGFFVAASPTILAWLKSPQIGKTQQPVFLLIVFAQRMRVGDRSNIRREM